jgi:tight adherence protein C
MDSAAIALAMALLVTLGCGLLLVGLSRLTRGETTEQQLNRLTASPHPTEEAELEMSFADRVLKPWFLRQVQAAGRLAPSYNIERLRTDLVRAGHPYNLSVLDFLGIKLLVALVAAVAMFYSVSLGGARSFRTVLLPVVTAAISFLAPDFWLGSRVKKRKGEIRRSLPDALDMLTICVDAGSGLDAGMLKISEKWQNAIATEFGKVVAEVRIGLTRREALQNLAWRTNVEEVGSFTAVLTQAEQFGLSIASVLHTQSEHMRIRRSQRAEEEARKVPIKLLFPLIFMIFPALLAVSIGPAIPILVHTLGNVVP